MSAPAKPRFKLLQTSQALKAMLVRCHEVSSDDRCLHAQSFLFLTLEKPLEKLVNSWIHVAADIAGLNGKAT